MKNTLFFLFGMSLVIGTQSLFSFWDQHDRAIAAAAERYETCVKAQYHTTPAAWYVDHGEYPECAGN